VVLVLVGGHDQVQVAVGGLVDLGDHIGQFHRRSLRAQSAAVDQDVALVSAGIEGEQEAVAEALAVHADAQLRQRRSRWIRWPGSWRGRGILAAWRGGARSGLGAGDAPGAGFLGLRSFASGSRHG